MEIIKVGIYHDDRSLCQSLGNWTCQGKQDDPFCSYQQYGFKRRTGSDSVV